MKIVKCPVCGRLIHFSGSCFFCGNREGFALIREAEVHENAREALSVAEEILEGSRFGEAQDTLSEVMKWSPNSPEVHWLRMLARAECRNDAELLLKGVELEKSPDFDTALRYAGEEERTVYSSVSRASSELRKTLLDMIATRNAKIKQELHLPEYLEDMRNYIGAKRAAVLGAWQELRGCEQELKQLEAEGLIYMREHKRTIELVRDGAAEIRGELEEIQEMAAKPFSYHKLRLDAMKKTADTAKSEFYRLRSEHPAVARSAALLNKRNELMGFIDRELDDIREYEKKTEAFISNAGSQQKSGAELSGLAAAGGYERVRAVIGNENFERAVKYALAQK